MASLVGQKLGTYQITELLGQGGMATVYKGYRDDIDRYVAIKVLPPHPGLDQQFIERFKLEARTIARLQHPHILPLYDYGVQEDILYLVMAYVDGGSLGDRIERGGLALREVETLLRQVASALDYAHRQGVIHRDIKPDNILLDSEGHALLADFGIVKLTGSGSRLTVTGGLVGTPAYMAPEQGSGVGVSESSDIYSLGVVVYEMLTGKQPYSADTPMQVVFKHMSEPVPNIRSIKDDLPPAVEMVMLRVLAKNPRNRYQTATEFADEFTRAVHTDESVAGMKLNSHPAPDSTLVLTDAPEIPPAASATNPNPSLTPPGTTTIIQQVPAYNPLLLLGGFAIIAVLVVVVVALLSNQDRPTLTDNPIAVNAPPTPEAVAALPTSTPAPTFGRLSFSTTDILGDTVTLQVENLVPLGGGEQYVAWLKNTDDDSALLLGELTLDALGSGVLPPYIDAEGRVLPILFNAISITRETDLGETPLGSEIYGARVPTELAAALTTIFVTSADGLSADQVSSESYEGAPSAGGPTVGLLYSTLAEANKAVQHAGLAQRSSTLGGLHLHNEHTINILFGTLDDYTADGRGENPGFKVGIPRFLDLMEAQLDAVAGAPGSSRRLQSDLEVIRVCLENTRMRVDRMVALEQEMLTAQDVATVAEQARESTIIAAALVNGVDANGNGQVEPFEEECGLIQIQTYGLLISAMNLTEIASE